MNSTIIPTDDYKVQFIQNSGVEQLTYQGRPVGGYAQTDAGNVAVWILDFDRINEETAKNHIIKNAMTKQGLSESQARAWLGERGVLVKQDNVILLSEGNVPFWM